MATGTTAVGRIVGGVLEGAEGDWTWTLFHHWPGRRNGIIGGGGDKERDADKAVNPESREPLAGCPSHSCCATADCDVRSGTWRRSRN